VKGAYRLIYPMEFEDGREHNAGDVVELSAEQAKQYAFGLVPLSEEKEETANGGNK